MAEWEREFFEFDPLYAEEDEVAEEFFSGVDKAATPAERAYTRADLQRN